MSQHVTLIDAAERLGVHYMTAYRYVRTGRLPAHKIAGQWQVEQDDLDAFSSTPPSSPSASTSRREVLPGRIEERLIAGDENGTVKLVEDAMASGAGAEEVYLDLISPAMVGVGARWRAGEISIADEHVATSTALRVIARIGPRVSSRGRMRGTILLATVSNDFHYLPTAILRDLLRFRGFDVQDLGANTPGESVIERAKALPDLLAVGISATTPDHDDVVRETLTTLEQLDVPVVLGGSAFADVDHIQALGTCIPSPSARAALDIFDSIHASARAQGR